MFKRRAAPTGRLAELAASPTWMYEFDLGGGVRTAVMHDELMSVHRTRAAIAEPIARAALGRGSTALDLACSEGWFAHRLLEWRAGHVVGIDVRPENIERAELVRDHLGVSAGRLTFEVADVFALRDREPVDVVLCLGLVYHLENPVGALRIARGLTRRVCIVESQLVEPHPPLRHGWGTTGEFMDQEAAWAAWYEPAELQAGHPIASYGGVVSFLPNRTALLQACHAAGFSRVEVPPVPADANSQYVGGHRLVVVAWP